MNEPFFAPESILDDTTSTLRRSLVPTTDHIVVEFNGKTIADTTNAIAVFETGMEPVYYFPPEDVTVEALGLNKRTSICPWKGVARYYNLDVDHCISPAAAWCYPEPEPEAAAIRHYIAFYPHRIDRCIVNGHVVLGAPIEP
ncbi:MAG TPA: DUF427 domain-containing protein [Thermomicrobiales bacterium]|nr:DUF427 domain-containing protein [Thermomicrobiales bacterium]